MALQHFFDSHHWRVVDVLSTPARPSELYSVDDLPLAPASRAFLQNAYPAGIYRHQKEALRSTLLGQNVCLVTGTASGKSLVFQTAAIDLLARNPQARIIAIYPMKALGNEQRERWQNALVSAGLATHEPGAANSAENMVGRIDGNVPPGFRLNILERSRVVVFTPDIIHAWLFSNLNQPTVVNFLTEVRLVVVDEVHAYSGVFGSNAAFLLRRLQHLMALLGARPRYIGASATIAQPDTHLQNLFGQDFNLVGPEDDSSPRFPLQVYLAEPGGEGRFLDEVVGLLEHLTHAGDGEKTARRFIAFVDSRKQVELISSILNRLLKENARLAAEAAAAEAAAVEAAEAEAAEAEGRPVSTSRTARPEPKTRGGWGRSRTKKDEAAEAEAGDEPDVEGEVTGVLQSLNVLPYRAGYEDHDRRQIQERLVEGTLNGVVSTSALELGIDVPDLDVCVLIGVPSSATSLQQRIGRIGRHGPGVVIVVNGGDVHDQAVFSHPQSFFQRPLAESALYLENEHIQYIHALCLARVGGEHDQVLAAAAARHGRKIKEGQASVFTSQVNWPDNFLALCRRERSGEAPRSLMSMKLEARERPNYVFPLRDVESQFKVERRDGPNVSSMGSLSFAQLMREAYPGAIYYYATIPYRVTRVNVKSKSVTVRREKRYTTQPQKTLPAVFPRLSPGGISAAARQDGLLVMETTLLVRESIRGVIEQRGRTENVYPYPLVRELGFFQDQPYFSRNYFTTGVVLAHPALNGEGVVLEALAAMIYEAFMLLIPFERQDIGFAPDHFRVSRLGDADAPVIEQGQGFVAVYDQIYGSLRLSSRLLSPVMLATVLVEATLLGCRQPALPGGRATLSALREMALAALRQPREALAFGYIADAEPETRDPERWERVVLPGSKGLMVRTNEEFRVIRILNTPMGISYEGTPASMEGSGASVMPLLADVAEVPGESLVGWYDVQTGAVEPAAPADVLRLRPSAPPEALPALDADWLQKVLSVYGSGESLRGVASRVGVEDGASKDGASQKDALIERLVARCGPSELLEALLVEALEERGAGE